MTTDFKILEKKIKTQCDLGDMTLRLPHERVLLRELDLHSPVEGMMVLEEFRPCWNRV